MVPVFLVGAGGVGKTTLTNLLLEESQSGLNTIQEVARSYILQQEIARDDYANPDIFFHMQVKIAQLQIERERNLQGQDYISDRSVVDAIVYASRCKPDRFPLQMNQEVENARLEWLLPLVRSPQVAREVLLRYRSSLVVVVHPFDVTRGAENDGVRVLMNSEELVDYTDRCRSILLALGIPFLDLKESSLAARLRLIKDAIEERKKLLH